MTTEIPQDYDKELYAAWHNSCIPEDADIIARLNETREGMKSSVSSSLAALSQLLTQIKAITEKECKVRFKGISQG